MQVFKLAKYYQSMYAISTFDYLLILCLTNLVNI